MDIIKEIVEFYTISSIRRFSKHIRSPKSHKKVVLKGDDKERIIFVPTKIMKMAQRYVLDKYLSELKVSDNAIAYRKGMSILDVARIHLGNTHFLHIDVKHFFDFMDWDCFVKVINTYFNTSEFAKLLSDNECAKDLKHILTFRGRFRQGSVTSPCVSNIYLFDFDSYLASYLKRLDPSFRYCRYSDDIFISLNKRINADVVDVIKTQLSKWMLRINYKKLRFRYNSSSVRLVGITLTKDNRLTISTAFKKRVKHMVYEALKSNSSKNFNSLYGHLYYLMMCDQEYFNKLQIKYKDSSNLLMTDRLKRIEEQEID